MQETEINKVSMNENEIKIYDELSRYGFFPDGWSDADKIFGVHICMIDDDMKFIKDNWKNIHESKIQDMLIILMKNNFTGSKMFQFLTSTIQWKIDTNYKNQHGNNCLIIACMYNNNLELVKYLIEEINMDPCSRNIGYRNCLSVAIRSYKKNLEIIKYLTSKVDPYCCDDLGDNFLMDAVCCPNISYEIVKFLIDDVKIDINVKNRKGETCGNLGCKSNQGLEIIKLLIPWSKSYNPMTLTDDQKNANNISLKYACMYNKHLDVVKYLTQKIGADPNALDTNRDNCLTAGCWTNDCLDIIKYLINDLKMDVEHKDIINDNCFLAASMNLNPSLNVIKYLITETNVDVNCINQKKKSCLHYLKDNLIVNFLINNDKINITLTGMHIERVKYILENISDRNKMNQFITHKISSNSTFKLPVTDIIKNMNPFTLTETNRRMFNINPFIDKSYDQCTFLLDQLEYKVSVPPLPQIKKHQMIDICDFTKLPEFLFRHGNEVYYGHRELVYQKIYHFKNMEKTIKDKYDHVHTLDGNLPRNLIIQYINSLYTGIINFEMHETYFIPFLKFIEQYPSVCCSINRLEEKIVKYIECKQIEYCEYLKELCGRYGLKLMYLSMHNRKFSR